MKQCFIALLMMCAWSNGFAQSGYNFPGGVVEFNIAKQSSNLPEVKFGLQDPVIMEAKNHWRVLIGISLDLLPGEYVSYIKSEIEDTPGEHKKVLVRQMVYPFIELDRSDATDKNWSVRIKHEKLSDIDFTNTQQPSLPLRYPSEGNWSDTFGHKMYDVENKTLHVPNSISLATTKLGTVIAPQDAIVSKTSLEDDGSSTIFLDHGRGLYSVISGLEDLTVEIGNGIVSGAVIGKLPSNKSSANQGSTTKRLVWQTILNGVYVNPVILTQLEP